MKKEDIINQVKKVVYDGSTVNFIIQTQGDNDFWYWQVCRTDIVDYFNRKNQPAAIFQLAHDMLAIASCEEFCNDIENDLLGVSCSSFETIEDALKDLGVIL